MSLDISLYCGKLEIDSLNVTHNLNTMVSNIPCGKNLTLYEVLWRPNELTGLLNKAKELITPLETARLFMLDNESFLKTFEPDNGWGTFNGLFVTVSKLLFMCEQAPEADIQRCR